MRDSFEREWRRERKRIIEESAKITASAAAPTSALEFWRQVVRCNGDIEDRWGHDGYAELERPGPPVPQSLERYIRSPITVLSRSPSTAIKARMPSSSSSNSSSNPSFGSKKSRKNFQNKKKNSKRRRDRVKKKSKSKKSDRNRSRSASSFSSNGTNEHVEWIEKCL